MALLKRNNNDEKSCILENGKKVIYETSKIWKKYDVSELIRIKDEEFPTLGENIIYHFNLALKQDLFGYKALLVKIIKHGSFKQNGEETLPVLSLDGALKVKIVSAETFENITKLPKKYFVNNIGNVANPEELKALLLKRYASVLSDLSDDQILKQGVSVRGLMYL